MKDLDKKIDVLLQRIERAERDGTDCVTLKCQLADLIDAKLAIQARDEDITTLEERIELLKEQINLLKAANKNAKDDEDRKFYADLAMRASTLAVTLYLISSMRKIEQFGTVTTKTLPSIMNVLRMICV